MGLLFWWEGMGLAGEVTKKEGFCQKAKCWGETLHFTVRKGRNFAALMGSYK